MQYKPHGAALEYLESLFHGPMRDESATVAVGAVSIIVADRDQERISLTLVNLSTDVLFVRPSGIASPTSGFRLGASGGTISLSVPEDGVLPTAEWQAIGAVAGGDLFRMSVRRESAS
jgi:hypothetical protein